MFERLARLVITHKQYVDGFVIEIEETLKELCKQFLLKHHEVNSLSFKIFCPTFNDGAPCCTTYSGIEVLLEEELEKFNVEKEKYEITEDYFDDEPFWNDTYGLKKYLTDYSSLIKDMKEIDDLLGRIEPLLENLYGVNKKITVNRSKIEIEEFECGY